MSHNTKLKTQLKDQTYLLQALNNLGYKAYLSNGQKINDYYGKLYDQNLDIIFYLKQNKLQGGVLFVNDCAEFHVDHMLFGKNEINKITDEYTKILIQETANDFGYNSIVTYEKDELTITIEIN
jgi:hypothetical protein